MKIRVAGRKGPGLLRAEFDGSFRAKDDVAAAGFDFLDIVE